MEPKYSGGETLYDGYHVGEPLLQKFISLDDTMIVIIEYGILSKKISWFILIIVVHQISIYIEVDLY